MKKILYIFIATLLMVLSYSCDKNFLDRAPLDAYSNETMWTNANDATIALTACYKRFEDGDWPWFASSGSDDGFDSNPWEHGAIWGNMQYYTPTNVAWFHKWDFSTIRRANWFLENIDKTTMDEGLKTRMKGEARFLRAYRYWILSQLYGDAPLVTKVLDPDEANKIARTPKADVVKFVLDELNAIANDLPTTYPASDKGRFTKGAALALKARTELYNGKFTEAAASAKQVMDLGVYSLFPNYGELFRLQNENNSEIVLDVEYVAPDEPIWDLGVMGIPSLTGGTNIWVSQSLVDAYEMSNGKTIDDPTSGYNPEDPYINRDPRLNMTVVVPGSTLGGKMYDPIGDPSSSDYYTKGNTYYSGYGIRKYISHPEDFDNFWLVGLNVPLIRYAEVLLTYAEAKIEANSIDASVYTAINQVRSRVGMPNVDQSVYNSQATMRELIRRERRVELAMEGLRYFDLQRWRTAEVAMNGPHYGCRFGTVDHNTGKVTFDPSGARILMETRVFNPAKNYLWPIPQPEIDIDKNLVQNPGY
jgi:starch-binding outer membrane protein, SusD/RagB family